VGDNNSIFLNVGEVNTIVNTLKGIKPKGFNSMYSIVALVAFFEDKVRDAQTSTMLKSQESPEQANETDQ
jgi:hypothetical protein